MFLACAALLLASCPPEAKTTAAKAAPPQLAISYCGVEAITSLTLVMGETPQKLTSNYAVSWKSGDDTTADVAADGTITLKQATAPNAPVRITATSDSVAVSFELTVLAAGTTPSISVKSEADLRLMGCVDGVSRLAATYTLANDITLTKEWEPIGVAPDGSIKPFTGTLDGAGNTIKNLFINKPNSFYIGLIGNNTGTIKNIGVELGAAGITGSDTVGGLAGQNLGAVSGVVTGAGSVTATGGNSSGTGGLVGGSAGTVIGLASVAVNASGGNVGGLVGNNASGGSVMGYATGNVNGSSYTGGLVGNNEFGKSVIGYYTRGKIQGARRSGGLAGSVYDTLTGYSRGAVSVAANSTDVGKVVGYADTTAKVNVYYSNKQGESTFTGGTANNVGTSITIDPTKTQSETGYFDKLTFGTAAGQWTFHQGKWPSINFPADKIFDPYRGDKQPIDP